MLRIALLFLTVMTTVAAAQQPPAPPAARPVRQRGDSARLRTDSMRTDTIRTDSSAYTKQVIQLPGTSVGLPFSSATRVGNVLYLSGQIGVFPGTRQLVDTGVVKQTQQVFENIKGVLAYANSSLERVFKCTVFLAKISDYEQMNTVYATYFPKDPPARSTVAGSGLALNARVEIECLATVGP